MCVCVSSVELFMGLGDSKDSSQGGFTDLLER